MLLRCQIKNRNIKVIFKKHEYTKWLNKDKNDNTLAFCAVCWKSFSVAADGKKAVVLHVSCEFHKSTLPTGSQITVKLVTDKPEENETIQKVRILLVPEVLVPVPPPLRGILQPKLKAVKDAEILWVLDSISNISQNSCWNKTELFAAMFKDSKIAQALWCGSSKCGYVVNFGLSSLFKSLLAEYLNDASLYVCCFEEIELYYQERTDGHACVILGQYAVFTQY